MPDKYDCVDCGEFTDGYMVNDELWNSIIAHSAVTIKDCLCLHCLESRMDRRLVLEDFPKLRINIPIIFGFHMGTTKVRHATAVIG